jgi:hypothetical protein
VDISWEFVGLVLTLLSTTGVLAYRLGLIDAKITFSTSKLDDFKTSIDTCITELGSVKETCAGHTAVCDAARTELNRRMSRVEKQVDEE